MSLLMLMDMCSDFVLHLYIQRKRKSLMLFWILWTTFGLKPITYSWTGIIHSFRNIILVRHFSTVGLMKDLQSKGVYATCAITKGRIPLGSKIKEELAIVQKGEIRFWKVEENANKLVIAFWKDKKDLFLFQIILATKE